MADNQTNRYWGQIKAPLPPIHETNFQYHIWVIPTGRGRYRFGLIDGVLQPFPRNELGCVSSWNINGFTCLRVTSTARLTFTDLETAKTCDLDRLFVGQGLGNCIQHTINRFFCHFLGTNHTCEFSYQIRFVHLVLLLWNEWIRCPSHTCAWEIIQA